jgi:hypothetical protein
MSAISNLNRLGVPKEADSCGQVSSANSIDRRFAQFLYAGRQPFNTGERWSEESSDTTALPMDAPRRIRELRLEPRAAGSFQERVDAEDSEVRKRKNCVQADWSDGNRACK